VIYLRKYNQPLLQIFHVEATQSSAGALAKEKLRVKIPPDHILLVHKVEFSHTELEFKVTAGSYYLAIGLRVQRTEPGITSFTGGLSEHNLHTYKVYTHTFIDTYQIDTGAGTDPQTMKEINYLIKEIGSTTKNFTYPVPVDINHTGLWVIVDSNYVSNAVQVGVDVWAEVMPVDEFREFIAATQFD